MINGGERLSIDCLIDDTELSLVELFDVDYDKEVVDFEYSFYKSLCGLKGYSDRVAVMSGLYAAYERRVSKE